MRPGIILFLLIGLASFLAGEINLLYLMPYILAIGFLFLIITAYLIRKSKFHSAASIFLILGLLFIFFNRSLLTFHYYPPTDIYHIKAKIVGFEGIVSTDVRTKFTRRRKQKHQEYGLSVIYVYTKNKKYAATGNVLIKSAMMLHELSPGDRIQAAGYVSRTDRMKAIQGFHYGKFLTRQGYSHFLWVKNDKAQRIDIPANSLKRWGDSVKRFITQIISSAVDKNIHAKNFISALLLGTRSELDNRIQEDFRRTGLYHVLALSGLHMGMIFAFLYFFFSFMRIKRKWSFLLTGLCLLLFTIVVGFIHSLVRALIMALCIILVKILERERDYINSLFWAGFLIVFIDPRSIYSVSFQLSFGATLGILTLFEPIHLLIQKSRLPLWITSSLAVTVSAQVFIFPLLLYYFGVFYPVSLIVNLICVPLVSFIAFTSLTGIILSFIPYAGKAYLIIAEWLTDLLFHIIKIFALTSPASLKWKMPIYIVLIYYMFCFAIWLYMRRIRNNQS